MAWLHAIPKPPDGTRRAKRGDQSSVSRLERLKADGVRPPLPSNPLPSVILHLTEMGLSEAAGMGVAPLSWLTIDAWQRVTAVDLSPWEARLIRRLSQAYVAEGRKAESENCPPPWRSSITQREIEAEQETLRMILG